MTSDAPVPRTPVPRATFFCGGVAVPSARYRVHPIEAALRAEGWETSVIHGYGRIDGAIAQRHVRFAYRGGARLWRAARTMAHRAPGPVVAQRLAIPWDARPELRLARRRPLVFDFDDAVFLDPRGRPGTGRARAVRAICAAAAHVVAGNSWLAARTGRQDGVSVVPTCIDTARYAPGPPPAPGRRPVLGWIGTSGNFPYLRQLVRPLAALRDAGHDFELRLCSDLRDPALLEALGARFERWTPEGELPFLQGLDIGLMPLADDDWCRGKCSFKMIQYMAVGRPVVASAVGMNRDVLDGGTGGRLVEGDAWARPLAALLGDAEARARLGAEARARAVARYDLSVAVDAYRTLLSGLQAPSPDPAP